MASGRGVMERKRLVQETYFIDLLKLIDSGLFEKGPSHFWTISWTNERQETASIGCHLETLQETPLALRFQYTITDRQGEKTDQNYPISLTSTNCHLGGKRWWFICPLTVNGQYCGRRCRILYLPRGGSYFGCRECYRLTYDCRQKHRDLFYEGFTKAFKTLENTERNFARARTVEERDRVFHRARKANAAIERFKIRVDSLVKRMGGSRDLK